MIPEISANHIKLTMPIERKLAAIMFNDIAGYTAQMSKDEANLGDVE